MSSDDRTEPKKNATDKSVVDLFYNVLPYITICQALYTVLETVNPYVFETFNTLDAAKKCYWTQSMVTAAVSVVLSCMAGTTVAQLGLKDFWATSPLSTALFRFFMGYIWADSLVILKNWSAWPTPSVTLIHHVVSLIGGSILDSYSACHGLSAVVVFAEITTPFITQMYFFTEAGMKATALYAVNGAFIVVFWFLFRICSLGWVLWRLFALRLEVAPFPIYGAIACLSATYALQWAWFYKIVLGALKLFTKA